MARKSFRPRAIHLVFVIGLILVIYVTIVRPAFIKDIISSKMSDTYIKIARFTSTNKGIPQEASDNRTVKRIVLWNTFFGRNNWDFPFPAGSRETELSCRKRCILSYDRTNPLSHDALVFHARDNHMAPKKRTPNQVYLMYMWESPTNRGNAFARGDNFYNWSATYSTRSDITMRYGVYYKLQQRAPHILQMLPQMQKRRGVGKAMVAWIVSNCQGSSGRFKYVEELKKHISVDVYGRCGKPCPAGMGGDNPNCFQNLGATGQYKFYLAFENSICEDYLTLKPFRALNGSMVPVVLGGKSTKDYITALPPNSFIDTRNFSTPKLLADYLKHLDTHDQEYLSFHSWRKDHYIQHYPSDVFCMICEALHNKTLATPRNVDWGQFWNNEKMCDNGLVNRLLSKI